MHHRREGYAFTVETHSRKTGRVVHVAGQFNTPNAAITAADIVVKQQRKIDPETSIRHGSVYTIPKKTGRAFWNHSRAGWQLVDLGLE